MMADLRLKDMFDHVLQSVPDATRIRVKLGESEMEFEKNSVEVIGRPEGAHPPPPISEPVISSGGMPPSVAAAGDEFVKAPLVGVFYASPAPDAAPFIQVGQTVKKGDTLCIIEAMKLMNEIESTLDGVVTVVLVENGDMVEFGQPLFVVRAE